VLKYGFVGAKCDNVHALLGCMSLANQSAQQRENAAQLNWIRYDTFNLSLMQKGIAHSNCCFDWLINT
jgi:hypothetical protein